MLFSTLFDPYFLIEFTIYVLKSQILKRNIDLKSNMGYPTYDETIKFTNVCSSDYYNLLIRLKSHLNFSIPEYTSYSKCDIRPVKRRQSLVDECTNRFGVDANCETHKTAIVNYIRFPTTQSVNHPRIVLHVSRLLWLHRLEQDSTSRVAFFLAK